MSGPCSAIWPGCSTRFGRQAAGLSVDETIADIDPGEWADLPEAERLAVNVDTAYVELDPTHRRASTATTFGRMAALAR